MSKKESIIVLLSITFCWSSSYIFIKDLSSSFSAYEYLALTSGLAGIILSAVFPNLYRQLNRKILIRGGLLAILIAGNIIFEKLALDNLSASAVSALATMNIIIVPVILAFRKQFPTRNNIAGIVIILIGLLVSGHLNAQGTNLIGTACVFASCLLMSLYTVFASEYTQEFDPLFLTILQLCITAVIGLVLWLLTDFGSFRAFHFNITTFSYIVMIAIFSKAYAYVMLMYAEKYADTIMITVIAATDPVVTLVLAIILPMTREAEIFEPSSLIGALIIAGGAVVAATKFLSPKEKTAVETGEAAELLPVETEAVAEKCSDENIAETERKDSKPSIKNSPIYGFLIVAVLFTVMGLSINNLNLFAGGYSELRPVNLIPVPAGILLGPVGAAGCAVGNFIQDVFWDYGYTSAFGVVANFLAAYISYKIWQAAVGGGRDSLHVHTKKNIFVFLWAVLLSSLVSAFILYYGMEIFFKTRYQVLITGTFANNALFSLAFGLPCFIVLTMKDSGFQTGAFEFRPRCGLRIFEGLTGFMVPILILDTVLITGCLAAGYNGVHWINNMPFRVFVIAAAILLLITCLIPSPVQKDDR